MLLAAGADPWRWQAHPEVWVLVLGILFVGWYGVRVIGPKVVPAGTPLVTRRQKAWFFSAVALLWIAADWPMHDIGEEYLYSVHMVQHLLISFVIPPMFLMSMPTWLARLVILDDGITSRWIRRLAKPIPAAVIFNSLIIFLHWQGAVTESINNGAFHFTLHVLLFTSALLMWTPVVGPIPEMRMSLPGRMIYLFLQSVVPTVPGAWLTFAENPVYRVYDRPYRLWDIGVLSDQQAAGAIMKILGGFYLWAIIVGLFFRWAGQAEKADGNRNRRAGTSDPSGSDPAQSSSTDEARPSALDELTYESLSAEFDRLGPARREPVPGGGDQPSPDSDDSSL